MGDGLTVLDLGCGTGYPIAVRVARRVSRYLGIDNSEAMLSAFRRNVPLAEPNAPVSTTTSDPTWRA